MATALAIMAGSASAAVTYTPIYDNVPSPLPGNVPSQPFQAQQVSEFGGQVEFSGPSANNTKVTVAMSSWACQSGTWHEGTCATTLGAKFSWPVTLKIYHAEPDNSVGAQTGELTQAFNMPYRPSANVPKCGDGRWYYGGKCFNGKLFKIVFPLKGVYLPKKAIISVEYNTSGYGPEPQGYSNPCNEAVSGCFYDSLNVGLTGTPTVGAAPLPKDAYINSATPGVYCDGGTGGTNVFRFDPGCWFSEAEEKVETYQPKFEVTTG
ncbi:MAG TPA: hypothetical protein VIF43_02990 [Patescibacteria group bacterium]|jgi:hypothetical protein